MGERINKHRVVDPERNQQVLEIYLREHQERVNRVLGPLSQAGRTDIREAGLDLMIEQALNPWNGYQILAKERTPEDTARLLETLQEFFTRCNRIAPSNVRMVQGDISRTYWKEPIITPSEFELFHQLYGLDGIGKDIDTIIESTERLRRIQPKSRVGALRDTLIKTRVKLHGNQDNRFLLSQFALSQPGPTIRFPKSKMPGIFVAEKLIPRS